MYHLQKAARVKSQSSSRRALCMPGQVSSVCVVQNNSGQSVNIAVFFLVPHHANTDSITIHLNK